MTSEFIELLKPQNVFLTKKRLGPDEDGGYTMPEFVYENCSTLFAYGIGQENRFELEFVKTYIKPAYLFDHTVYREEQKNDIINATEWYKQNGCVFTPTGLGFGNNCNDFYQDYLKFGVNGYVFLKIDIEAGEYDYFSQTDMSNFENTVMGMSLEVHWINDPLYHEKLLEILKKIEKYFILCHIHGNNWGLTWKFEEFDIPDTLELSFINKKLVEKYEPDDQDYPIEGLDYPNNRGKDEYKLTFLKYKPNL